LDRLRQLLDEVPEDLRQQVFTHASWTDRRSDSYSRLAFLGDSVLGLAITAHLYPRLEAERYGAGRLTKIRAQTVSGPSCRAVAERLGVPERLAAAAPSGIGQSASTLTSTERVLASVIEAVIGACYLHAGLRPHGRGGRRGVHARDRARADAPGGLQVDAPGAPRAARRGGRVRRHGRARPAARPHVRGRRRGRRAAGRPGSGRSKKHAEQEAARAALDMLDASRRRGRDEEDED
jgi:ribonuclease-3